MATYKDGLKPSHPPCRPAILQRQEPAGGAAGILLGRETSHRPGPETLGRNASPASHLLPSDPGDTLPHALAPAQGLLPCTDPEAQRENSFCFCFLHLT